MLSMPLFISLFLIEEFRALEPISIPSFARFPRSPFPDCLHFFLIFFKAGPAKFNRILLLFFLGPIFLGRVTLIFLGSCFQLILSYLARKVFPFGRFTTFGVAVFLSIVLSFIFLLRPLQNIFPSIGFAISPKIAVPIDASRLIGIAPPFCHLFFLFYMPHQYTKGPFLQTVSPYSFQKVLITFIYHVCSVL